MNSQFIMSETFRQISVLRKTLNNVIECSFRIFTGRLFFILYSRLVLRTERKPSPGYCVVMAFGAGVFWLCVRSREKERERERERETDRESRQTGKAIERERE